jgi:hypothetical protein
MYPPCDEWKDELSTLLLSEGYEVVMEGEISLIPRAVALDGRVICDIMVKGWAMAGNGTEEFPAHLIVYDWAEQKTKEYNGEV